MMVDGAGVQRAEVMGQLMGKPEFLRAGEALIYHLEKVQPNSMLQVGRNRYVLHLRGEQTDLQLAG